MLKGLVNANSYSNSELHYSFVVPGGWVDISQDLIDEQTRITNEIAQNKDIYFRKGYYLENSNSSEPPYMLVQENSGYAPFDKVVESYKQENAQNIVDDVADKTELLTSSDYNNFRIDEDKKIIFANLKIERPNKPTLLGLQAIFFGLNSQVSLNFYALESDFDKYERDFNQMIETFSFEQDFVYKEKNLIFDNVLEKGFIGAISGGILSLFVLLFSKKSKRKNNLKNKAYNKKRFSVNKKNIYIAIALLATILILVSFFYKNHERKKENVEEPITSDISEVDGWSEYYLDNDKYKISFPNEPTKTIEEIDIITSNSKFISYNKYTSSTNGVNFSSAYFEHKNLLFIMIALDEENNQPRGSIDWGKYSIGEKPSGFNVVSNIYEILFKKHTGFREIEKINNHFYGYNSIDYIWKNINNNIFIKGKIIQVDNKDIYILTSENSENYFKDYEKFVYSWEPFGDLSE